MRLKSIKETPFRAVAWSKPEEPGSRFVERVRSDIIGTTIRERAGNANVSASICGFWAPVASKREIHSCPPFFSFNSKDQTIDDERAIALAKADIVALLKFLDDSFDIRDEGVKVFFNAKRGFHVYVDQMVLMSEGPGGMEPFPPSKHQVDTVERMASFLSELLSFKTMDADVYRTNFALRIVDSVNTDTGGFVVELTWDEVHKLSPREISALSSEGRGNPYGQERDPKPNAELRQLMEVFEDEYARFRALADLAPKTPISVADELPVCIKSMAEIREVSGNEALYHAAMIQAAYFRDVGTPADEAVGNLALWAERRIASLAGSPAARESLLAMTRSIARKVYRDKANFVCSVMLAMRERKLQDQIGVTVACDMGICKTATAEGQEVAMPPEVELDRAVDPSYAGRKVRIQATVSGGTTKPLLIPYIIKVTCPTGQKACGPCPANAAKGSLEVTIPAKDPVLLEFVRVPKDILQATIRKHLGIPAKCAAAKIEVVKKLLMHDVSLIPIVKLDPEVLSMDRPYVNYPGLYIGDDGMRVVGTSREWEITSILNSNPKDQTVIFQITEAKEITDFLSSFAMNKDLFEQLRVFQPSDGQTEQEKFDEITEDLTHNVVKIYHRPDLIKTMDLAFHSVTSFFFKGDFLAKGWMDVLVIGDSGQGKTHVAQRLIEHYGLGTLVQGESATRTGLLYALTPIKGGGWDLQWGKIPLNDMKLVVIDELSGIADEDRASLTQVRSQGFVEISRVVGAKAMARTRLIFLTNPDDRRKVNEHAYGVDAISSVFKRQEDVRRLDLADVVASGEVDPRLYTADHHKEVVDHKCLPSLCRHLLLWVWSRKPEQIEFQATAVKAIDEAVDYLSSRYSPKIELCEPADLKNKVARISAAVAARLFSTTDRETLTVKKEHVAVALETIDGNYSKKSMGYLDYSQAVSQVEKTIADNCLTVEAMLKRVIEEPKELKSFVGNMLATGTFTKSGVWEFTPIPDKDKFNSFFRELVSNGMLQRRGQWWVRHASFTGVLRRISQQMEWDRQTEEIWPDDPGAGEQVPPPPED